MENPKRGGDADQGHVRHPGPGPATPEAVTDPGQSPARERCTTAIEPKNVGLAWAWR